VSEAAVGDVKGSRKRAGRLAGLLARKRTEPSVATKPLPPGYQPFSKKLAPSLVALGGLLSLGGALGVWIRTSQVVAEGLQEEQVAAVMGYEADWGRLIAVVAGIATVSAVAWLTRILLLKLVSIALSIAVIVLSAIRLPVINDQAAGLAYQARTGEIDFISFHAGFGWGAWSLIIGAVALFLGITTGVLRELDVRRESAA